MSASRVVDDLLELAAIPAPTFAEEPRIAWLERRLLDARGTRAGDEVGNLLWTWGEGRPQLLLLAHVDTVFAADTPLSFARDGDQLVGPGIGDNAAAVALIAHVVADLLEREGLAPGAVAFTVGEEGIGNLRGAFAACSSLDPEAVIAVEGHGLDRVLVDAVGSVRACVRVTGPGGHSWEDRGRLSAIHVLLELGRELAALGTHDAPVNIGLLSGGQSVNTIAAEAQLAVELRALDTEAIDGFVRRLDTLEVVSPLVLDVAPLGRRPAGRLPRESPLLAAVRRARSCRSWRRPRSGFDGRERRARARYPRAHDRRGLRRQHAHPRRMDRHRLARPRPAAARGGTARDARRGLTAPGAPG